MRSSRTLTALVGLVLGLLGSVAAWVFLETLLLFLFLPFVPFLFGWGRRDREHEQEHGQVRGGSPSSAPSAAQSVRHCPRCEFRTAEPEYEYCPRDGVRLRADDSDRQYS